MEDFIKKNKPLVISLLVMFLIILLATFTTINLFHRISSLQSQINSAESQRNSLQKKVNNLRQAQIEIASSNATDVVAMALPAQNPSLLILSQIRTQIFENQLSLIEAKVDKLDSAGKVLLPLRINLSVEGKYNNLSVFLDQLPQLLPLLQIESLEVRVRNERYQAELNLRSYWSPFPETLPALTQAINPISASEKDTIQRLSEFTMPSTLNYTTLEPSAPETRSNPFAPFISGELETF